MAPIRLHSSAPAAAASLLVHWPPVEREKKKRNKKLFSISSFPSFHSAIILIVGFIFNNGSLYASAQKHSVEENGCDKQLLNSNYKVVSSSDVCLIVE